MRRKKHKRGEPVSPSTAPKDEQSNNILPRLPGRGVTFKLGELRNTHNVILQGVDDVIIEGGQLYGVTGITAVDSKRVMVAGTTSHGIEGSGRPPTTGFNVSAGSEVHFDKTMSIGNDIGYNIDNSKAQIVNSKAISLEAYELNQRARRLSLELENFKAESSEELVSVLNRLANAIESQANSKDLSAISQSGLAIINGALGDILADRAPAIYDGIKQLFSNF